MLKLNNTFKKLKLFLILCLNFTLLLSAPIIPDQNNPMVYYKASKSNVVTLITTKTYNTLTLRFSFAPNSVGLDYK